MAKKKITVLTGGAFDILHIGHLFTLEKAKSLGDKLIVVVARDETIERVKGRKPIHAAEYRRKMVGSLKPVDIAVVGEKKFDIAKIVKKYKPDIIVFGYDQRVSVPESSQYKVVKLKRHFKKHKYKTSEIIRSLEL